MPPASPALDSYARKQLTVVLQRLASVGLSPAAQAIGVDESTVSRMKSVELPRIAQLLSTLGLKVVPEEYKCYPLEHLEALRVLANAYLAQTRSAAELAWEDE